MAEIKISSSVMLWQPCGARGERSRSDLRSIVATPSVWVTAREEYASAPSSFLSDLKFSRIYDLPRIENRESFVGLLLLVVLAFAPVIVSHIGCFDDCMKVCQESPTECIKICNLTCVRLNGGGR
ncbi:hypothetical protein MUK42_00599 [Musa troglodytarum]|uniref:Uncharacterized protein n=1 Tax=Musa troglodytarum TaxID=320322 RepID=A0A9E7JT33_9LILI|nr:hypothetical protein MUK42_00599 [Musa troglodytarum]